jgi:hypothetical protein
MAGFAKSRNKADGGQSIKHEESAFSVPKGTTAKRPTDVKSGEFRYNTDNNLLEYFNGTVFKSVNFQGVSAMTQDSFTGNGSTTGFTMSTSITSNQTQRIVVAVGNVFQNPASAYTLSGTTITFTSAPASGETITVIHGLDSNTSA